MVFHPNAEGGEGRWELALDVMMCLERHGQPQGRVQGPFLRRAGNQPFLGLKHIEFIWNYKDVSGELMICRGLKRSLNLECNRGQGRIQDFEPCPQAHDDMQSPKK